MPLNSQQVSIIEADVESAALTLSILHKELVDHICCEIEALMADGKDFSDAYAIVKKQVSISTLQSIEKNTMLLIDKNYSRMKTFMKISGNISLALIVAGTIMKINSITGASVTLVVGFLILCFGFLPSLLYSYKPDPTKKKNLILKFSAITGGISFTVGILFKAMNWNGANILLLTAYAVILLITLPTLLYEFSNNSIDNTGRRINMFGVVALMVFILSTMFKMFHLPSASILLLTGSVMLVSIFLPLFTYREYKKSGTITGKFIFIIILCFYIVTMSLLMSYQATSAIQNIVSIR